MGFADWVRSALGRAPTAESEKLAGSRRPDTRVIAGALDIARQFTRIGGNLTPQTVSAIIQEADTGNCTRLIDLANEARQKDCHLQGILHTRETAIAATPWQAPAWKKRGRKEPKARDRDTADWVEDCLLGIAGGPDLVNGASEDLAGFSRLLSHLAGAAYYGFAVAEVVWGNVGGVLQPIGFNLLAPRRFIFNRETGRLCWNDSGFAKPIDVMREFPPGKFIVHQPRINGDVPAREGLVRALMWAALFRNWALRDWMSLAEVAWKPWRTGVYKKGASTEDIDNLWEALQKLTSNGVGVFPETTDFKVQWPSASGSGGATPMHGALCEFLGGEMSKAVLGQTLTTEAGHKGARSLGEVHDGVRKDVAQSDCNQIASTIRAHLVGPMVRLNKGPDIAVPGFEFITEENAAIADFSLGVANLKTAGLRIPAAWVRDRLGIPEPDDDDELLSDGVDIPIDPSTGLPAEPDPNADDSKAADKAKP